MSLNTTMKLLPKDIRGAINECYYCDQHKKCYYWDRAVFGNVCYDCFDSVVHTEKMLVNKDTKIRHPTDGEITPENNH